MSYAILQTDTAKDQMYAILQYIAEDSDSVDTALNYLDCLEREILKLGTSPHMGSLPRYSTLKRRGYRVLIVRRHLIFYTVDDEAKQVMIHAVVDARQHYVNLI